MKNLKKFNELFDYGDQRKRKHIRNYDFLDKEDMIITMEEVLKIHDDFIENYGGIYGIRDEDQLESAILKPYTSAFGEDVYPTVFNKASALLEALLSLHAFADGNKRTAWHSTEKALDNKGYKLNLHYDDARPMLVNIIENKVDNEEISKWLEENSTK